MCMCIECVGDQPEPMAYKAENGKWHISYMAEQLTGDHDTEDGAWAEFDARYSPAAGSAV